MTKRRRSERPHVPELFAVECPACRMALAARGELAGAAARCPLCHADFCVPIPPAAGTADPAAAPQENLARPMPPPGAARADASEPAAASGAGAADTATSAAKPSAADVFDVEVTPQPAPDPELAFREPVPTIGSGDEAIELRRLSPEEKQRRRARRNAVMLLVGALVLIVITILLGRSGRH